jgi:hypothetical protein
VSSPQCTRTWPWWRTPARPAATCVVLLNSPVVKADKKEKVLEKVFAGKVGT